MGCTSSPREIVHPLAAAAAANVTESCGWRDDGLIHFPPGLTSFAPPPKGLSYRDPQYGCTIRRLTDGKEQFNLAVHHQYSTISAMNEADTRVMLITEWGQGVVVDPAGKTVVSPSHFPPINSGNVPWSKTSPDVFYYTNGDTLYRANIHGNQIKTTVLRRFKDRSAVIPDEEDLSEDGDHLWIVAGTQAFLYTISSDNLGPGLPVGTKDSDCGWHKIQITPSNKALVTWSCSGAYAGRGQEVYDADSSLYWHMFNSSVHSDVGRDLKGEEVAVVSRIPDTYSDACPKGGGVDRIMLDPPHTASCLVDVNWAATHISYRDTSLGWVIVSFFDQGNCPHYSCFANRMSTDWESLWRQFYEEVILVKIDGSAVYRLAHHRSRSAEYYWAQSRASISRDARYVVFDSNMGIPSTGLNSYSDVYLIKVR
jgi:hypothetical protein